MSDLGGDVGNASISLMTKLLGAFVKLLEQLYKTWENNPQRQLTKYKLKDAKTEQARNNLIDKMDGKVGYVKYQKLKKTGLPLTPCEIDMTKEEMKQFAELAKRENLLFTGMKRQGVFGEDGKQLYALVCKTSDLERMKKVVDRMNDEKQIEIIDNRIAEIKGKGELTPQDEFDIEHLIKQKEAIQDKYVSQLNDLTARGVTEKAVNGITLEEVSLDSALNLNTGRSIDKDRHTIVADAKDPDKYIKCHGYEDTYNGKSYIKTDYEVYNGTQQVFATNDGRFDGRPKGFWEQQKSAMIKEGGLGDTFFKFSTMESYVAWAKEAKAQNLEELKDFGNYSEDRNYDVLIGTLKQKLEQNGAEYQSGVISDRETGKQTILKGVVNDKETGKSLSLDVTMGAEERANIAESVVIGKQIDNYMMLKDVQAEITLAKVDVLSTEDGTPEKAIAEEKLQGLNERLEYFKEEEISLVEERKAINAVQAEQISNEQERNADLENSVEERADNRLDKMNMQEVKEQVEERKAKSLEPQAVNETVKIKAPKAQER